MLGSVKGEPLRAELRELGTLGHQRIAALGSRSGRGLLPAPRTDPYVRNHRIRLLPLVMT
jgi:hypothetical protein